MCAVYTPTKRADWVQGAFGLVLPVTMGEVYPGHLGPIVVRSRRDGHLAIGMARFGLVPPWAKDNKIARHTYNARLETIDQKPSFRAAWRNAQFAVVIADCFYEPCYETGKAQRWRIGLASGEPMGIAALWERWTDPQTGAVQASFTMITINAQNHPLMSRMHKPEDEKRTPEILPDGQFKSWLGATPHQALDFLQLEKLPQLAGQVLA